MPTKNPRSPGVARESTQSSIAKWLPWSPTAVAEICRGRGIEYEETSAFDNLKGVAVTCEDAKIVCVRASLSSPDKVFTVARLLGHLALHHKPSAPIGYVADQDLLDDSEASLSQDAADEAEASIWASHLLVDPRIFDEKLGMGEPISQIDLAARERAVHETSAVLNIPKEVVALWLETRGRVFSESPVDWVNRTKTPSRSPSTR